MDRKVSVRITIERERERERQREKKKKTQDEQKWRINNIGRGKQGKRRKITLSEIMFESSYLVSFAR